MTITGRTAASFTDLREDEWQRQVIELARMLGWHVAHFRAARTKHGWATPVQGDGAGWPDLVLVRDRVIYAELKRDSGRLRPEQEQWQEWLERAGAETYVFRPRDLERLAHILAKGNR